ncbi:hypothetical protein [Amycolatopsis kentuckyensis]|uniref:hypothetical protein n=1 Tax=Amycolatopsis kentuckyensis TaxID=218823 RepID=UPI003569F009
MSTVEHARRLVGEHLLLPDDEIVNVREDVDDLVVESHRWRWRVSLATISPSGWQIYDVELDVFTDPSMTPYGFAIEDGGRVLRLDDRAELAEFWRLTGPSLTRRDIATLLIRYHGGLAHLLDDVAALGRVVGTEVAAGINGLVAPVSETDGALAFCTWQVDADGTVAVHRWEVRMPDWDRSTLANHLTWLASD